MNQINPNDQLSIRKVVMAGMKLMYNEKTFPLFEAGMKRDGPTAQKLAEEAAGLVKMLQDKAKGAIPRQILLPAAGMLVMEMAKFMQDAGYGKVSQDDIKVATKMLLKIMPKAFPKRGGSQARPGAKPPGQPPAPPPGQPQAAPAAPAPAPAAPPPAAQPRGLINSAMQRGA